MNKKPKILLLSDDMRMGSGVATVSKQFVLGTVDRFDWVQLGAAIKHPDQGKILDLSESATEETGVEDASVRIYPWSGYGDDNIIRQLLMTERPDAILHFTDPRYWIWLYEIAHEIREIVPIGFYHIWDDLPDPMYNRDYFESCDWIGCISKQTYGIVNRVWGSDRKDSWEQFKDWQVDYVPHGINPNIYFPITDTESDDYAILEKTKLDIKGGKGYEYDFILLWVNRNIRRKQPGDVILSFKMFNDMLSEEQQKRTLLIMHTQPVDDNGTDLIAVKNEICPNLNVVFSNINVDTKVLNALYNVADLTINIANNEGFGLTTAESVMAGTPIIVNVTGGLQDQCGFTLDGKILSEKDYIEIGSLHDWRKWETNDNLTHGEWVTPIWPKVRSLNGSPPTPYIFDDRVDNYEVANAILHWYQISKSERDRRGLVGREWFKEQFNVKLLCDGIADGLTTMIKNHTPYRRFKIHTV